MPSNDDSKIEIYKGRIVKPCNNRVVLIFSATAYKKIIDVVEEAGLSPRMVLAHSGTPCERCRDISVTVYNRKGQAISIKRGLLPVTHQESGNNKKLINTDTGETYSSAKDASRKLKIKYSTLIAKLNGNLKNDLHLEYD